MADAFTVSPSKGGKILKPSEEALNAEVIRELLTGEEYRRKLDERKREQKAFKEACQFPRSSTKGLGRCVAVIPEIEFFAISAKYGYGCWDDRGFMKDFQKRFPHLAPNRA